ncbi:hypothetical protein DXG03_005715 [Asterophora parasitica]|uniref:Uncharacterized protein n=1 Tax=Asterophora parasitica TaxID=117018 RepID=A0A9P7GE85_9AGAR|nr:hypothetical protein DXG03_005715 [Asterophora parasitica]
MDNESTFVAPEGVYTVTDEHKPPPNFTPYGGAAVYPTRVTSVVVTFPAAKSQGSGAPGFVQLLGGNKDTKKDKPNKKEREDGVSLSSSDTPDEGDHPTSSQEHAVSQEPHTLFSPSPAGPGKKKSAARPKHNIRTTSSTFITRIQNAEGLAKTLQSKQGDTTFLFYNIAKSWLWVESGSKSKDPLCRITFSHYPTCHDVNISTASHERLDVVIGFSSGDLVWLVSHADGTIVVYDKERDDGAFVAQDPVGKSPESNGVSRSEDGSHKEWDPVDSIFVTMPPWHPITSGGLSSNGKSDKEKQAKNPVSHWRVSRRSIVGKGAILA